MKAIVWTSYGPPEKLKLQQKETPSPKDNEVLVRVHASSVNALDRRMFTLPLLSRRLIGGGWRRPKKNACGADVAGTIDAVGASVTQFRPGDSVFGLLGLEKGAFAEYACLTENRLTCSAARPSN